MNKANIYKSFAIVLVFIVAIYGRSVLHKLIDINIESYLVNVICFYLWWIIPTVLTIGLLFGFKNIFKISGLNKNILKAFTFSLIAVSPMLISSATTGSINSDSNWFVLLKSTLFAGFFEEYLFRAFLFGILFKKLGWGFIPAALLGSIFFGFGHIYQSDNFFEAFGIFTVTAMGAAWYAWLYIEWESNIWVPIFLHTLMNLSWALFETNDNALGDIYSNIFRIFTIAITIIATIYYNKKSGLVINKRNLLVNRENN